MRSSRNTDEYVGPQWSSGNDDYAETNPTAYIYPLLIYFQF